MNPRFNNEMSHVFNMTSQELIAWLRSKGLLTQFFDCIHCGIRTKEVLTNRNCDSIAYRCMNTMCSKYGTFFSIRINSFFHYFKIDLKDCLKIVWKWHNGQKQVNILAEVNISPSLLCKFFKILRGCCKKYFNFNPIILGGPNVICEVDESLFRYKPKFYRGRAIKNEIWVFGIADTSFTPCKVFLQVVPNRTANTLLPLIHQHCRPGSIIYSDMWRAYNELANSKFFSYASVNHSENFVDPITNVHTQHIESFWAKAKNVIVGMKGVYGVNIDELLFEFMFKENVVRGCFEEVISLIKLYY